jgi:hypothetical protein
VLNQVRARTAKPIKTQQAIMTNMPMTKAKKRRCTDMTLRRLPPRPEIMQLLLLCGRQDEIGRWGSSGLTAAEVRERLVDDKFKTAAPQSRWPGTQPAPVMSPVAFAARGLRLMS